MNGKKSRLYRMARDMATVSLILGVVSYALLVIDTIQKEWQQN